MLVVALRVAHQVAIIAPRHCTPKSTELGRLDMVGNIKAPEEELTRDTPGISQL